MACDCGCVWLGQHKGRWLGCVGESVGGSGELVRLLLDVCWDRIVGRGKVSH